MADKNLRKRPEGPYVPKADDDMILCRCEEITKGDIRRAIHAGLRTVNELKRETRMGMGLCQGQTCTRIIRMFLAGELGTRDLDIPTPRTPARPLPMTVLAADGIKD